MAAAEAHTPAPVAGRAFCGCSHRPAPNVRLVEPCGAPAPWATPDRSAAAARIPLCGPCAVEALRRGGEIVAHAAVVS